MNGFPYRSRIRENDELQRAFINFISAMVEESQRDHFRLLKTLEE